jgi:hypothetical protein
LARDASGQNGGSAASSIGDVTFSGDNGANPGAGAAPTGGCAGSDGGTDGNPGTSDGGNGGGGGGSGNTGQVVLTWTAPVCELGKSMGVPYGVCEGWPL